MGAAGGGAALIAHSESSAAAQPSAPSPGSPVTPQAEHLQDLRLWLRALGAQTNLVDVRPSSEVSACIDMDWTGHPTHEP